MKYWLLLLWLLATLQAYAQPEQMPLDDITPRRLQAEERQLPYPPVREADILWEQRVWRTIDTREKINLPFRYPEAPLVSILLEAIEAGELRAFSPASESFAVLMEAEELQQLLYREDTIPVYDFDLGREVYQVVQDDFDPASVVRYRLKEQWYFDSRSSSLQVRILGIAPIVEDRDERGHVRFEQPLFWVYFPEARQVLHRMPMPQDGTYYSPMSWADLFEMRKFASHVIKVSNIQDARLEALYTGRELLLKAEQAEENLFNREIGHWQH